MGSVSIKTAAQLQQEQEQATKQRLTAAVQRYLDETAQERNYDSILSLCTYASSGHARFSAEAKAGVKWRDDVWAKCYEMLAEVEAGTRPTPTEAELLSALPQFTWPSVP